MLLSILLSSFLFLLLLCSSSPYSHYSPKSGRKRLACDGATDGCFDFISLQGEIRITGFNQEVDKFYSLIEVGKVRTWVARSVRPDNARFSRRTQKYRCRGEGVRRTEATAP